MMSIIRGLAFYTCSLTILHTKGIIELGLLVVTFTKVRQKVRNIVRFGPIFVNFLDIHELDICQSM